MNTSEWVTKYNETKKLPSNKIPCQTPGCKVETTCFGSNLEGRLAKVQGNVKLFLESFKCRQCRKTDKPVKLKKAAKANKPKKTRKTEKSVHVEKLKEHVKSFQIDPNAQPIRYNFNNPHDVEELTKNTCQRPDIFLNNDRACDGCVLYDNCACTSKQLLAHTGRKKAVAGPKRKK